ncbi:MAG: hypothetical protein HRU32_09155 [Rhodobacteraceae bacterium]|nr:hypothetical protein [Paracoccaceae bacterium]
MDDSRLRSIARLANAKASIDEARLRTSQAQVDQIKEALTRLETTAKSQAAAWHKGQILASPGWSTWLLGEKRRLNAQLLGALGERDEIRRAARRSVGRRIALTSLSEDDGEKRI